MCSESREKDNRDVTRYQCKDVLLHYRKKRSKLASLLKIKAPKSPPLPVRDISRNGVCFLSKERLQIGHNLILYLKLNPREPRITVEGEVVWTGDGQGRYSYRVGVGFTKDPHETWESLKHMEKLCSKKDHTWRHWTLRGSRDD